MTPANESLPSRFPDAETIKINPQLEALIPPPLLKEVEDLEATILKEGCRDALVIWEETGELLDGHHRHRICKKHDLPFRTLSISLPDETTAKVWVVRNQLSRRNLDFPARCKLALDLANLERGDNQHTARAGCSLEVAAKAAGVSVDSIGRLKRVHESGTPELVAAVEKKDVPIKVAAEIAALPKEEQTAIVRKRAAAARKTTKVIKPKRSKWGRLVEPPATFHVRVKGAFTVAANFIIEVSGTEASALGLARTKLKKGHIPDTAWSAKTIRGAMWQAVESGSITLAVGDGANSS